MSTPQWYVAYTYSKFERKVLKQVVDAGYEAYLPVHKVYRKWSDRVKQIEMPLFPSYLFINTLECCLHELKDMAGIAQFVAFGGKYATIRNQEIQLIKDLVQQGKDVVARPELLKVGQRVRVVRGPFRGLVGVLEKRSGKNRLVVNIDSLRQNISVEMPMTYLRRVHSDLLAYNS